MRCVQNFSAIAIGLALLLGSTSCKTDDPGTCTPECAGRECGDDGCSGTCGTCTGQDTCNASGVCESTCIPVCTGMLCGDDGCGGSCGTCDPGTSCDGSGQCIACTADCTGRECGDDGCNGSCGDCDAGEACDGAGQCVACAPDCSGSECGDDGCGGTCGTCSGSDVCVSGQCECQADCTGRECGDDGCGGSCGTCPGVEICTSAGQCVTSCTPDCTGLDCGNDGCGGSCGTCSGQDTCVTGHCECQPACAGKQCGADGCGGSCGTCSGQDTCVGDQCVCQADCAGKQCGNDGCGGSCGTCSGQDTCVSDQCVCQADCAGKQCGADGCGGSCGTCSGQDTCVGDQCVCQADCAGKQCGADGCGGSCGICTGGEWCSNDTCIECNAGDTECVTGDFNVQRVCQNGQFVQQACGNEQMCAQDTCRTVCDGVLSTTTYPAICYMPHAETGQILWYANNTSLLSGSHTSVGVFNGSNPAAMYTDNSLTWPSRWSLNGLQGSGCIGFRLNQFSGTVSRVTLGASIKHAGIINNLTNWIIAFFDPVPNNLGSASGLVSWGWAQEAVYMNTNMWQFNSSGSYNSACIGITGNGMGDPPDLVDMNWMLLEIQP